MKPTNVKRLQYFVGKVCTIFVNASIQRLFNDMQFNDYFVGLVDAIDEDGILTTHTVTGCKNYFFLPYVAFLSEEQLLNPDNPSDAEIIKEFKKEATPVVPEVKNELENTYYDMDLMAQLAKESANSD